MLIHNATIYKVDDSFGMEEALAVRDGKIFAIGPEREIMNQYQSKVTIDAKKQFVYPGFIDAHSHFIAYGKSLQSVNLVGTKSWEECLERIVDFAESHPNGWITGRGWDQNDWEVKEYPTFSELNELFPKRPVLLRRIDGHGAVANSSALELAGITSTTEVEGGFIEKNENGLTGILVDRAVSLVSQKVPEITEEEVKAAIQQAEKDCFEVGLTTVTDAGLSANEIQLLQKMHSDSILLMDVYAMVSNTTDDVDFLFSSGGIKTSKLSVNSVKVYADGALGSRGARLLAPYSDDPHNHGMLLTSAVEMRELARRLYDAGFQMNTHCIGDSANRLVLQIYGEVLGGVNDKRWRIEHSQVVDSLDFKLYQDFTIIPSIQPTHATSDMYWAEDRLGKRIKTAYAYQQLLAQNSMVALGTDFPIEGISPLETFYSAVFRRDHSGYPEDGFRLEDGLTPEQALRGMTIWAALASFEEDKKGSLELGKKANITILNRDLMTIRQEDFEALEVTYTIVDGKVAFKK